MEEQKKQIYLALSKAQGEMGGAKKTAKNDFTKKKYSDLADVIDAIKEPLTKHGLSYTHTFKYEGENIIMITTLWHESGENISSEMPLYIAKRDPQSIGTLITYYKRYMIQALLGLPSEDDDGNESSKATFKEPGNATVKTEKKTFPKGPSKLNPMQLNELYKMLQGNLSAERGLLGHLGNIESLEDAPSDRFYDAVGYVRHHMAKEAINA